MIFRILSRQLWKEIKFRLKKKKKSEVQLDDQRGHYEWRTFIFLEPKSMEMNWIAFSTFLWVSLEHLSL